MNYGLPAGLVHVVSDSGGVPSGLGESDTVGALEWGALEWGLWSRVYHCLCSSRYWSEPSELPSAMTGSRRRGFKR